MATETRDGRPVLAAIDFSFDAETVATYAADTADRLGRPLQLVHVARIPVPVGPTIIDGSMVRHRLSRARAGLCDIADGLIRRHPTVAVTAVVLVGDPVDFLLARARDAFTLVIGARGLGGHPVLRWGSVSNRVVSRAQCPVIVVRSSVCVPQSGPIIVAADTPMRGDAAVLFARLFSGGHVRYCVSVHSDRSDMDLGAGGLPLDSLIVRVMPGDGDVNVAVRQIAADYGATLIVLAHERHSWPFRFGPGSAVHDMIEMTDCPLAVVDGTAARSPDTQTGIREDGCNPSPRMAARR